jgi:hypothetical protein
MYHEWGMWNVLDLDIPQNVSDKRFVSKFNQEISLGTFSCRQKVYGICPNGRGCDSCYPLNGRDATRLLLSRYERINFRGNYAILTKQLAETALITCTRPRFWAAGDSTALIRRTIKRTVAKSYSTGTYIAFLRHCSHYHFSWQPHKRTDLKPC